MTRQRRPEVAAARHRSVTMLAASQVLSSLAIGVGPSVGVLLAALTASRGRRAAGMWAFAPLFG